MPAIKKPGFDFDFNIEDETKRIRAHQIHRRIPERKNNNLLIASWNFANLGDEKQQRSLGDLMIMAEILIPFDLIAVQEVKDDFRQFRELMHLLGDEFDYLITDRAGNDERLGFIYRINRVQRLQLAGELVVLEREHPTVEIVQGDKTYNIQFIGFNRNPYLCAFRSGQFIFTLSNVHIYYGASSGEKFRRRAVEVYTLAKWAYDRVEKKGSRTFDHDIILIGDFNIPKLSKTDIITKQLMNFGMQPTNHSSYMGSNLDGHKQYDQIAFHPGHTNNKFTGNSGVFDFDKVLFPYVWNHYSVDEFNQYIRYHISDHRLIWSEWSNITP